MSPGTNTHPSVLKKPARMNDLPTDAVSLEHGGPDVYFTEDSDSPTPKLSIANRSAVTGVTAELLFLP